MNNLFSVVFAFEASEDICIYMYVIYPHAVDTDVTLVPWWCVVLVLVGDTKPVPF